MIGEEEDSNNHLYFSIVSVQQVSSLAGKGSRLFCQTVFRNFEVHTFLIQWNSDLRISLKVWNTEYLINGRVIYGNYSGRLDL
jgi:hypothetical protein